MSFETASVQRKTVVEVAAAVAVATRRAVFVQEALVMLGRARGRELNVRLAGEGRCIGGRGSGSRGRCSGRC